MSVREAAALMRDEVFAVPSFVAGTGPFPDRSGHIEGSVGSAEGRAALATLYTVLMADYCLDQLGAKRGDLVIEGSSASNLLYAPLLAALRPTQPVFVSRGTAGAARGAALLATWPAAPSSYAGIDRVSPSELAAEVRAYRNAWRYRAEKV